MLGYSAVASKTRASPEGKRNRVPQKGCCRLQPNGRQGMKASRNCLSTSVLVKFSFSPGCAGRCQAGRAGGGCMLHAVQLQVQLQERNHLRGKRNRVPGKGCCRLQPKCSRREGVQELPQQVLSDKDLT